MKTILVPTDFSANADNALDYAIELAKTEHSKLILLNVYYTISTSYLSDEELMEEMTAIKKDSLQQLKLLSDKIRSKGDIKHETLSVDGLLYETILSTIKEKQVDLVIMGTRGGTDIASAIFGSNTAKMIEKATCPVIAVPAVTKFSPLKKITYATNFTNNDIGVLKKLVEIAKAFNAQINVLHISENPALDEADMEILKSEIEQNINYNNISFEQINGNDIEQSLEDYVETHSTDLLVMATHHRNLFGKLFGKSITKQMAYQHKVPLMAFHLTKESAVKLF